MPGDRGMALDITKLVDSLAIGASNGSYSITGGLGAQLAAFDDSRRRIVLPPSVSSGFRVAFALAVRVRGRPATILCPVAAVIERVTVDGWVFECFLSRGQIRSEQTYHRADDENRYPASG